MAITNMISNYPQILLCISVVINEVFVFILNVENVLHVYIFLVEKSKRFTDKS